MTARWGELGPPRAIRLAEEVVGADAYGGAMTMRTTAAALRGRRRVAWWAMMLPTVVLGVLCATLSIGLAFERAGQGASAWMMWLIIGCLGVLGQPALLLAARARPVAVGYATSLASLLWPLGWFVPVVAWALAIVYAPAKADDSADGDDVPVIGLLTAVGTWWITWRDSIQATDKGSLFKLILHAPAEGHQAPQSSEPLPWWFALAVTALLMTLVGTLAQAIRSRREGAAARARTARAEGERDHTRAELGRQVERERIAREVHDTLGHRLSLLSVHAGALELQAEGHDEEVSRSAAMVRQGARQAMDDLRSLVGILREDPDGSPAPSLVDLPAMIDEVAAAGDPVVATVYLHDVEGADEALSRAVYRIVQELLTNARKHAPGAPVRLVVEGSPVHGVSVETANRFEGVPRAGGAGLAGVRERAELLGGSVEAGPANGVFRARAWLPWRGRQGE